MSEGKTFSAAEIITLLHHFERMIGPYGLYQHATGQTPLLAEGYCTDDNARAVLVLTHLKQLAPVECHKKIESLLRICWQFLLEAEEQPGTYYNFRSAAGKWLSPDRSDDMYARLFRALANVITHDKNTDRQRTAEKMLPALVRHIQSLHAPRFLAESIIAVTELPLDGQLFYQEQLNSWLEELRQLWHTHASSTWPWFEPMVTYANALFPHSFWRGLSRNDHPENEEILQKSADFLITTTIRDGMFIPIGSNGWYPRGETPSRDNQQPIEAGLMFDFLLDYQPVAKLTPEIILAPYLWLFGKNTHRFSLVDPTVGICRDGLLAEGPNHNCGAESLLAYLWAEIRLKQATPDIQLSAQLQRSQITAEL